MVSYISQLVWLYLSLTSSSCCQIPDGALLYDRIGPLSDNISPKALRFYDELFLSCSAQPSKTQLEQLFFVLKSTRNIDPSQVYILDLRQEPHIFINGTPACISSPGFQMFHTWDHFKTLSHEDTLVKNLKNQKNISVHILMKKSKILDQPSYILTYEKPEIRTEKNIVESLGAHYMRLAVTDHNMPNSESVTQFIHWYKTLPKGSWIHIHCRGGKGRTTQFATMINILSYVSSFTLDEILERQKKLGGREFRPGHIDHKGTLIQDNKRYNFLRSFYEYINSKSLLSWVMWCQNHS